MILYSLKSWFHRKHSEQQIRVLQGKRKGTKSQIHKHIQALLLQFKFHIQLKCLTLSTKSRAFFLPCLMMRSCMEWEGQGKELGFGSLWFLMLLQLICDTTLSSLPDLPVLKLVFCLMSLFQRRVCSSLLISLKLASWALQKSTWDHQERHCWPWLKELTFIFGFFSCKPKCFPWNSFSWMKISILALCPTALGGITSSSQNLQPQRAHNFHIKQLMAGH